MKHIIVGTAGHIDHGKTALVAALTGIDTDRLKEEKERGISIDLGFAHLDVAPDVRLSIIDVPGHERFIRNMLAGVAGIDIVLFAVAADESIRPQTREHFDICRLLGIRRGIVALTKTDAVDREILDLVRCEVEEFVHGSFLEAAPIVAVSAKTGAGLDELRSALAALASAIHAKDASRCFRLPIDRAFSMRGFGTVVTGTLISGAVRVEDEVELHPSRRRLRVRGLQVHNEAATVATAGQRTALNLPGVEPAEIKRGMVLAEAGRFHPTRQIDCAFQLLAGARPLKHRAPVHFHAGTAELIGEVRILSGRTLIEPGSADYVRILFREPLLVLPGDRFIVRMFSPVMTIGGGVVLDIAGPRRAPLARLETLERGTNADRVALLVRETEGGAGVGELVARTGLRDAEIADAARAAGLVALPDWFVDKAWFERKAATIQAELSRFHREKPLLAGMPREDLRGRVAPASPAFVLDALLAGAQNVESDGDLLRLAAHRVAFRDDEREATRRIEAAFEAAGFAVPAVGEVLAKAGVETARARTLLHILLREKRLVRVSEDLVFHAAAIERLRELLAARRGARFAVADFKTWTGISRKYAIPLLEFLDRERLTRREGDARVVL
ncbi:MAG: selenocysteine-specific translation elongation factor [Bryobacteraceae bacterium]|jgi:selenocysteine-specific elongation factor